MIFVTVGSIFFDELVREVDLAVVEGYITDKVITQIGYGGSYEPVQCEYFRSSPGLASYYSRADLVIGHGGTGTTFEVLERGLRLISVSNPNLSDNHQSEFLEALEDQGLVRYCRHLADLPAFIQDSLLKPPPSPLDISLFFRKVVNGLENWPLETTAGAPRNRSWINWVLGKIPPVKLALQEPLRTQFL